MAFRKYVPYGRDKEWVTVSFAVARGRRKTRFIFSLALGGRIFGSVRRADLYADANTMRLGVVPNEAGIKATGGNGNRLGVDVTMACDDIKFDDRRSISETFRPPFWTEEVDGVEILVVDLKEAHDAAYGETGQEDSSEE